MQIQKNKLYSYFAIEIVPEKMEENKTQNLFISNWLRLLQFWSR